MPRSTPNVRQKFDLEGCGDGVGYQPVHIDSDVQGKRPDVDGLALLLAWSGLDALQFVPTANEPEPLAKISANLRADRNLSNESARALEEIIRVAYEQFRDR